MTFTARLNLTLLGLALSLAPAQDTGVDIAGRLRAEGLFLAQFTDNLYRLVFPAEAEPRAWFPRPAAISYINAIVGPAGRSVFALRNDRGGTSSRAVLILRALQTPGGPEEIVTSDFQTVRVYSVSANERFVALAGSYQKLGSTARAQSGIFLLDRKTSAIDYLSPFSSGEYDDTAQVLNVNDLGNYVVYEGNGAILSFDSAYPLRQTDAARPECEPLSRLGIQCGRLGLTQTRRGRYPALLPDGKTYIYYDRGWLLSSGTDVPRELFRVPGLVGGIRLSPNGSLVAFGIETANREITQLRICEIRSGTCVDGPKSYDPYVAGRDAFWMKR